MEATPWLRVQGWQDEQIARESESADRVDRRFDRLKLYTSLGDSGGLTVVLRGRVDALQSIVRSHLSLSKDKLPTS